MTGKGAEAVGEKLADLVVKSVKAVVDENGKVDVDDIKVEKKVGGTIGDSELIQGLVIDKERIHPNMPKTVKNAKIALLDTPLEIEKTEIDAKIEITSPDQLQTFLDQEEKMLKNMVDKIKATGANVVFCQKGVDDLVQHYLAKDGIMAARRVKESDLKKLAKATGATREHQHRRADEGRPRHCRPRGRAQDRRREHDLRREVQGPEGSLASYSAAERSTSWTSSTAPCTMRSASSASSSRTRSTSRAAAPREIELALRLKDFASTVGGREQLAIEAFAEAMEVIPRTLAENAGLDPIDTLVNLRSKHEGKNGTARTSASTCSPAKPWT